jgi:hypothetical protein
MLGISPVLLWRATVAGELASVRIRGRRLYAIDDLTAYITRCRAAAGRQK